MWGNVEPVSLRAGPALLIEEFDDDGTSGRVTVVRSTRERIFCVLANHRQLALKITDALVVSRPPSARAGP